MGPTPADTFPIEQALTRNSRFLYVLDTRLLLTPPDPATLRGFGIHHDGHLSSVINPAAISLPLNAVARSAD